MKNKIMPSVVLTMICIVVCALLVVAYNVTYVDNTGILTDDLKSGCVSIFGDADYKILTKTDDNNQKTVLTFDIAKNIIVNSNNDNIIFEIVVKGYKKDGLDILIGIDQSKNIKGVKIVSISETPGLGTKVNNENYLSKFNDINDLEKIKQVDSISGATYSSKGVKNAVSTALKLFNDKHNEIIDLKNKEDV